MSQVILRELKLNSAVKYVAREGFVNEFPITFAYDNPTQLQVFVGFKKVPSWELKMENGLPSVVLPEDLKIGQSITIRRATPADGVPHTYQYKGNAQGGAEFSAKTIDENFEYMSELVAEVEDYNTIAQDNLNDIEQEFKLTQEQAKEALNTANSADSKADTALTSSADAVAKSEDALGKAVQAVSTANSANSTAGSANATAKRAESKADGAVSTANEAERIAMQADSKSDQANTTASSAVNTAQQAVKTAGQAKDIAAGIDGKAQLALDTSQDAVNTADSALSTASDAKGIAEGIEGKADQAISIAEGAVTTAKGAEEIALEAMEQVQLGGITEEELISKSSGSGEWVRQTELDKKWDTQNTTGTGNIVRTSVTDALSTKISTAQDEADTANNNANTRLEKSKNLSDLMNTATARNNLGLGSSATLNKTDVLGTSTSLVATQKLVNDTKINLENSKQDKLEFVGSGKVMRERAYGLGSTRFIEFEFEDETINSFVSFYRAPDFDARLSYTSGIRYVWDANGNTYSMLLSKLAEPEHFLVTKKANGEFIVAELFTDKNTTIDKSGFLRVAGSANALTTSDVANALGTSTTLVASQALVNDVSKQVSEHGLGYGQKYTNVTPSRAFNTSYSNNTNRPILVIVSTTYGGFSTNKADVFIDDELIAIYDLGSNTTHVQTMIIFIPPRSTYKINSEFLKVQRWVELR